MENQALEIAENLRDKMEKGWFQEFKGKLIDCGFTSEQANSITNMVSCGVMELAFQLKSSDNLRSWLSVVFSPTFLESVRQTIAEDTGKYYPWLKR